MFSSLVAVVVPDSETSAAVVVVEVFFIKQV
jgi:hypothetical protein